MSGWPTLSPEGDHQTLALLHLASQMLGKVRVANSLWVNHGWHATLRPDASGLATLPTAADDGRTFVLELDLCRHGISLQIGDGASDLIPFAGNSVAQLHGKLVATLDRHGLPSRFHGRPNEIADAVPFALDDAKRDYDPESARRLHQALQLIVPIFERFRAGFRGKASPVHMFWGAFDLAVTRFSGREAPRHPGGIPGLPDRITREAYSHEVSSAGFWAGGVMPERPFFYSYAYPEPAGFRDSPVRGGGWNGDWQEFALDYEEVSGARDPEAKLMAFLESTYAAAANLAHWDRAALEREPVAP